jgi:hypothetical protein
MPEMFGANPGYRFTSSRVTQDAVAALGAEAKYPNAIDGQLFFKIPAGTTQPKGNYVCSATVQRPRIITTAGHCVSDGSGHFFAPGAPVDSVEPFDRQPPLLAAVFARAPPVAPSPHC